MQCFAPISIPVLNALAQQFAVFDHWFCAGTIDLGSAPLNDLQQSLVDAIKKFYAEDPVLSVMPTDTARDAKKFLAEAEKLRHRKLAPTLYKR